MTLPDEAAAVCLFILIVPAFEIVSTAISVGHPVVVQTGLWSWSCSLKRQGRILLPLFFFLPLSAGVSRLSSSRFCSLSCAPSGHEVARLRRLRSPAVRVSLACGTGRVESNREGPEVAELPAVHGAFSGQ